MSTSLTSVDTEDSDNLFRVDNFFDPGVNLEGVTTSYTPETPEVLSYREQIRQGDPNTLYEFLQNAFDYNNYSKGSPELKIVLKDDGVMSLEQLLLLTPDNFRSMHSKIDRVEISNWIDEDKYYRVEHLIQTRHGGDDGTLGEHGRGGKAGSTALIEEGCVSNIQFSSRDEKGPWKARGEVSVRPDLFSAHRTPSYNILFQNDIKSSAIEKTVVTFNNPDLKFFELLFELPQKFLLINPKYQGSYPGEKEVSQEHLENLFTVWTGEPEFSGGHSLSFSSKEVKLLSIPEDINFTQTPRVEILPAGIVPTQGALYSDRTKSICVDGLVLESNAYYALQWSFWGCNFGKEDRWSNQGYFIGRSSESRYAQGEWKKLMALTLGKCANQEVFKKILDNSYGGSSCAEGSLPQQDFEKELKNNPDALAAFTAAWKQFSKEHNITKNTLFTRDDYVEKMMAEKGQPVFKFDNETFYWVLLREKLISIAEHEVQINDKPESTGDKMKLPIEATNSDAIVDQLFEMIIERDNQIQQVDQGLEIKLAYPEGSPPASFHHLSSTLRDFIRDFYSYCGHGFEIEIIFDSGDENSMRFILNSESDHYGRMANVTTIDVSSGKVRSELGDSNESGLMTIRLKPTKKQGGDSEDLFDNDDEAGYPNFKELLVKFMAEFEQVSADGKSVDLDLFAEKYSGIERGVFSAQVMAQKREIAKQLKKIEAEKRKLGIVIGDTNADDATRRSLRTDRNTPRVFTTLFAPDSNPRASNASFEKNETGESKAKNGIVDMISRLVDHVDSLKNPDINLLNPQFIPAYARTTLVATINSRFSGEIPHAEYGLDYGQKKNEAGIVINKKINSGVHAVPTPLDCQLTGFYHPNPEIQKNISFAAALDKNLFSIQAADIIPPGLELYFEHKPSNSLTTPATELESQELFDINFLPEQWKKLVETVNQDETLNEKQKSDIALSAWLHAFTYDSDPEVDNLVAEKTKQLVMGGMDEEQAHHLAIISISKGNCGYVSEGFLALTRAMRLESTKASAYSGDHGRFFPGPNNHGINLVKIDGSWTYIEPQRGYLSNTVSRTDIPSRYRSIIRRIPMGIRNYANQDVARENTGIRDVIEELKKRQVTGDSSVRDILTEMGDLMRKDASMYDDLWANESITDENLDEIANKQPSIEQIIDFLAKQPLDGSGLESMSGSGAGFDFSDLPPELLAELIKSMGKMNFDGNRKGGEEGETIYDLRETIFSLREKLEEERAWNQEFTRIALTEENRLRKRLTLTRIITAVTIATAVASVALLSSGAIEIGGVHEASPALMNLSKIIVQAFVPTPPIIPTALPPVQITPEIIEAITSPALERPLPMFSLNDLKILAPAFFLIGAGSSLGGVATLYSLITKKAQRMRWSKNS